MCIRRLRPAALGAAASASLLAPSLAAAQVATAPPDTVAGIPANDDEALVGSYTLPDPLTLASGARVRDSADWFRRRRPEIVRLFEENQFGRAPGRPAGMRFDDVFDRGSPALDGKALRRQVTIDLTGDRNGPKMDLLVYLPAAAQGPFSLVLELSFVANSSVVDDPGVRPGTVWGRDHTRVPAPAPTAGGFGRVDVARFLDAGFGFATVYYGDIEPDFAGDLPYGIRSHDLRPGQTAPASDEWGAIAAWARGLSRALDYLETDPGVDARRVALLGVSRLGKTVLWAGARDPRFATPCMPAGTASARRTGTCSCGSWRCT